jgi:DNA polymerase III sliding clamp (beta) subunit (PCNA family)
MLEELRFVQGAVAKKDFLPALTHFRIENGTVRSFNGDLALSSPIAFDIECSPKAVPFVKAIQNCNETVVLQLTPAGRLNVRSGAFNAFIECTEVETPHVLPEGEFIEINGVELLAAFKVLQPLIGEDASRPWSNGLLLRGQSAFATNNVILAEYWIGTDFPIVCNIPRECINEMLRIKTPPVSAQISSNSITFHYESKRWIRTGLRSTEWPPVESMLSKSSNPVPVNPQLFKALANIEPFSDKMGRVYIYKNIMATCMEEGEGARFEIPDLGFEGVYQIEMLRLIEGVTKQADFTKYPEPSTFFGDRVRGLIIGLRS